MLFLTAICENSGKVSVIYRHSVYVVMCDQPGSRFWTSLLLYADEKR